MFRRLIVNLNVAELFKVSTICMLHVNWLIAKVLRNQQIRPSCFTMARNGAIFIRTNFYQTFDHQSGGGEIIYRSTAGEIYHFPESLVA